MLKKHQAYILTSTAADDFRNARRWSLSRWGKSLTKQYFADLHEAAEKIAQNYSSFPEKWHLIGSGTIGLGIYAVREHYMIYMPITDKKIVIVALIRQIRDVPSILEANSYIIRRELKELLLKTEH